MENNPRPPHPNNCPPGHIIAMAHGGHGHWDGDGCCNGTPTANIDMGIFYLVFVGVIIILLKKHKFIKNKIL